MAIAAVTGATANLASAGSSLAFAAIAQTSGQINAVAVAILTTSVSVSSITDGTNTYTLQSSQNNGSAIRVELWTSPVGSSATRTITINFSGSTLASAAYEAYSGSTGIGNVATPTVGATYAQSSVATQDQGSFAVAAIAAATSSGDTFTSENSTLRRSLVPALTTAGVALMDVSAIYVSPAALNSMEITNARVWAATSVELRTGVTATGVKTQGVLTVSDANSGANKILKVQLNAQQVPTTNSGFVN